MSFNINSLAEYQQLYKESVENPEGFWANVASNFTWKKKWDKVLEWNFTEPKVEWFKGAADPRNSWQHYVKQIMSRRVVTVLPTQPIQDLVPYFVEKSFNYIPVVEDRKLIGMISRADMIAALQQQLNRKL